jgi:hypothetical protein
MIALHCLALGYTNCKSIISAWISCELQLNILLSSAISLYSIAAVVKVALKPT